MYVDVKNDPSSKTHETKEIKRVEYEEKTAKTIPQYNPQTKPTGDTQRTTVEVNEERFKEHYPKQYREMQQAKKEHKLDQQTTAHKPPNFEEPPIANMAILNNKGPPTNTYMDFRVYNPFPQEQPAKESDLNKYPMKYFMPIPQYSPFFPYYAPNQNAEFPVIKNYSIYADGPTANHEKLKRIYHDVIPSKQLSNTSTTISERMDMMGFVRTALVRRHDGEDIDLTGKQNTTLLSYLKFLDLNPYNPSHFSNSPYEGLPDGMLIYRSCYPVRYDSGRGGTTCAHNSIGMNVRLYKLNQDEYNVYKEDVELSLLKYNVWRELIFYEYIRENIIRKFKCPNFVMLLAYFVSEHSGIDFAKVNNLRNPSSVSQRATDRPKVLATMAGLLTGNTDFGDVLYDDLLQKQQLEQDAGITKPLLRSDKALVCITESPTYSLAGWATRTYKGLGTVKQMTNTGYHSDQVWKSILFQMFVGLYVLEIHQIFPTQLSIENNVYIKDISLNEHMTTYWKYIINGLEYYVPNYGYQVLIDTNYADIATTDTFKIESNNNNDKNIHSRLIARIKENFGSNMFGSSFIAEGGARPNTNIIELISSINKSINTTLKSIFINEFSDYLHNRIGTFVRESEKSSLSKEPITSPNVLHVQTFYIYNNGSSKLKFVYYVKQDVNQYIFLTTDDSATGIPSKIKLKQLELGYIYEYFGGNVSQDFKPNKSNLNDEDLLETYTLNYNDSGIVEILKSIAPKSGGSTIITGGDEKEPEPEPEPVPEPAPEPAPEPSPELAPDTQPEYDGLNLI